MALNTKENDWLVASLNNIDYSASDFESIGLTSDNTLLLSKEDYKKSLYIQNHEAFKNEEGNFDNVKFDKFYNIVSRKYEMFANKQYEDKFYETLQYEAADPLRPDGNPIFLPTLKVERVVNPLKIKSGVSRLGFTDNQQVSDLSIAESSKVFNYAEGKFEKYTPNDLALFESPINFIKSLGSPLVLAQWEDDDTHIDPWTGRKVQHHKGELKTNELGDYYYETLDGRDPYGKRFRTVFDNITSENSDLNKYDFFDSNDLDKSTMGIVAKTAALIVPLFIPGVNAVYGYVLLGSTLTDVLPNLYKATLGVTYQNDDLEKIMNSLGGFGLTLKSQTSQHAAQSMLGLESLANIISDVSLQWAEQRAIFKTMHKMFKTAKLQKKIGLEAEQQALEKTLRGADAESAMEMSLVLAASKLEPIMKSRNRIAANVALGYMSMLQGLDTYQDALAQGATKELAAIWTWGAIAGMYTVDRLGLGELFFPELREIENEAAEKVVTSIGKEVNKGFGETAKKAGTDAKGLAALFVKAKDKSASFWHDVRTHSTTFTEKALGEGLEEVSEELCVDLAKASNNALMDLGWNPESWTHKLNAFENAGERYAANFLGGAVGGMVFAGVDLALNLKNSTLTNQELIYLLRNGKKQDILEELERQRSKGLLGNTELSAKKSSIVVDELGNKQEVWQSGTKEDNQNEAAFKMITDYINALDKAIYTNGLNLSDSQVLDKLIMGDQRVKALLSYDHDGKSLMLGGFNGKFLQKWNLVALKILDKEGELLALKKQFSDPEKRNDPAYLELLDKLTKEKKELLVERDAFFDGTYSKRYLEETLFSINKNVNHFFFAPNFSLYAQFKFKKEFDRLSPEEIEVAKKEYETYLKDQKIDKIEKAYDLFTKYAEFMNADLGLLAINYEEYHKYKKFIESKFRTPLDLKSADEALTANDMEAVGTALTTNMGYSVDGNINEDFVMWEVPIAPTKVGENPDGTPILETEESFNARIGEANTHNQTVINNIKNLILKIAETGYVDEDIKTILKNTLGTNKILQLFLNATSFNNASILGPKFDALVTLIKSETNVPKIKELTLLLLQTVEKEFLSEDASPEISPEFQSKLIKNLIPTLIVLAEMGQDTFIDLLTKSGIDENEALDLFIKINDAFDNDGDVNGIINKFLNTSSHLLSLLKNSGVLNDFIKNNIITATQISLRNFESNPITLLAVILDELSISPLDKLISKLSINAYGKKLTVFEMLKREKGHLRTSKAITEYTMSKEAVAEINLAMAVLNMTEAVINAASTDTDGNGHFAIVNDFTRKYLKKNSYIEYSLITNDNRAAIIDTNLSKLRKLLDILLRISEHNRVNLFAELQRVGTKVTKILAKGIYDKIKLLPKIGEISLIDGISSDILDVFDKEDATSQEIMIAASKLETTIYNNFRKMVTNNDLESDTEVFSKLLENVTNIFNVNSLENQELSDINGSIKSMTDYELYMYLTTILSLNRALFNHYSERVLLLPNLKFAPLINQLLSARIICAQHNNPDLFNVALNKVFGENYAHNMSFLDGIGGAGKTSVVARMVLEIDKEIDKTRTVWLAGPTSVLVKNLKSALETETDNAYEIVDILGNFLTEDLKELLKGFLDGTITDNDKLSELFTTETVGKEIIIHVNKNLKFAKPTNSPDIIYIDESTHANTILHTLLVEAAKQCDFCITNIGDLYQNGAYNTLFEVGNLLSDFINCVRTSKLDISMRISNTLKKDNSTNTLMHMRNMDMLRVQRSIRYANPDIDDDTKSEKAYQEVLQAWDAFKLDFLLLYYEDDTHLNGEKIVSSVTSEDIAKLVSLKSKDTMPSIGLVYDDTESSSYKAVEKYEREHPGVVILKFTPNEVQGSECDYFIIDVKTTIDAKTKNPEEINNFLKNFYTMITRSKKGTLYVDNNLTKIIKPSIKEASTGESPDPTEVIKLYRETFISDLLATNKAVSYKSAIAASTTSDTTNDDGSKANNEGDDLKDSDKDGDRADDDLQQLVADDAVSGSFEVEDEGTVYTISPGITFLHRTPDGATAYAVDSIDDGNIKAYNTDDTSDVTSISVSNFKDGFGSTYVVTGKVDASKDASGSGASDTKGNSETGEFLDIKVDAATGIPTGVTVSDIAPDRQKSDKTAEFPITYVEPKTESATLQEETIITMLALPSMPADIESASLQPEEGLHEPIAGDIPNVRVYGWYQRDACNVTDSPDGSSKIYRKISSNPKTGIIEDLNLLLPNTSLTEEGVKKYRGMLSALREVILSKFILKSDNPEKAEETVKKALKDRFRTLGGEKVFNEIILYSDLTNGLYLLKVSKFNEDLDTPQLKQGLNMSELRGLAILTLVYRFKTKNGSYADVTIGILANPTTWERTLQEAKSKNDTVRLKDTDFTNEVALLSYKTFCLNKIKDLKDTDAIYYDIPDGSYISSMDTTRFAHVLKDPTNPSAGYVEYDFETFMQDNPTAIASEPFIFAGNGDPRTFKYYKDVNKLKGKPCAFVCADPIQASLYLLSGAPLTAKNIAKAYKILLSRSTPPYIRMMMLDPKAIYAFDTIDLFHPENTDIKIPGFLGSFFLDYNGSNIETYGSVTTAAKVLVTLWNLRSNLLLANEMLKTYNGNIDAANKALHSNDSYCSGIIIEEHPGSDNAKYPGYYMVGPLYRTDDSKKNGFLITRPKGKPIIGFKISPQGIKLAINSLNLMFRYIAPLVPILKDANPAKSLSLLNGETTVSKANTIAQFWYDTATKGTSAKESPKYPAKAELHNGDKVIVIPNATPKDQALILLSQLIRIPMGKASSNDYNVFFYERNEKGKLVKYWKYDLSDYSEVITEVFADSQISAPSFITAMINLALHGQINTNGIVNSKVTALPGMAPNAYPTFTPFPDGFHYHSRYNKKNKEVEDEPDNFHEAEGSRNMYKTDVVVERGNFKLTIPASSIKLHTTEVKITEDGKQKLISLVKSWKNTTFSVSINDVLNTLQDNMLKQYELLGDTGIILIQNEFTKKYNEAIKTAIKNHTLRDNETNDYVYTISPIPKITGHLLCDVGLPVANSKIDWNFDTDALLIRITTETDAGTTTTICKFDPITADLRIVSKEVGKVIVTEVETKDRTISQEAIDGTGLPEEFISNVKNSVFENQTINIVKNDIIEIIDLISNGRSEEACNKFKEFARSADVIALLSINENIDENGEIITSVLKTSNDLVSFEDDGGASIEFTDTVSGSEYGFSFSDMNSESIEETPFGSNADTANSIYSEIRPEEKVLFKKEVDTICQMVESLNRSLKEGICQ